MSATDQKLAVIEALIEAKKKPVKDNSAEVKKMAEQAIASMRDTVNSNQAVMGEIVKQLSNRPVEFIVQHDNKGKLAKIIPVYEK